MPHTNLFQIHFCFPHSTPRNKRALLNAIVDDIRPIRNIGYAGYEKTTYLRKDISWRFDAHGVKNYRPLSLARKKRIEKIVSSMIRKCHRALPMPSPLFVFIFPWLGPFDRSDKLMGYVTGFTSYPNTMRIFVSPNTFSRRSLRQTVAHEFSHAVFFHRHPSLCPCIPSSKPVIRDVLIWEGIAENFTEDVTGAKSPVPQAITRKVAQRVLGKLRSLLEVKVSDRNRTYEVVFFGGRGYKKWTGYSVGYHIVKSFRASYPQKSWRELVRMDPKEIFDRSPFTHKK